MGAPAKTQRKKTSQNPGQFSVYFQDTPSPMWICDLETLSFLEVNKAAVKCYGYSRAKFRQMRLLDIYPKEDVARLQAHLQGKQRRLQCTGEWRHIKKNGALIHVDITCHSVTHNGRKAVLMVVKDITGQRKAQESLKQSEQNYQALFEHALDGIFRSTPKGRFISANPALIHMLGYNSEEELLSVNVQDLYLHPEDRNQNMKKTNASGELHNLEVDLRCRDGSTITVLENVRTVRDPRGKVIFYEGTLTDITERKRAEEALQENEARLRSLFENTTVGFYRTTPDGRILFSNPALVKMLEYDTFDELAKKNLEQEGNDITYSHLEFREQIEREGKIQGREGVWRTRNGTTINIRQSAHVVRDEKGKVLFYEGTIEDITERKKAEEALRASESELRALFSAIPDLIMVVDKDGRYLKIVSSNSDLLYQPTEDLIGKRMHDIFSWQKADRLVGYIQRTLQTQKPVRFEYALLVNNKIIWFSGITAPLAENEVVWVARDITSQKQNEERIQRRLTELQALYESGLALGHTMDTHTIGEQIIHVLKKHLDWRHATVRLRREDSDEVELLAFGSRGNKPSATLKRVLAKITHVGQGMSGWVMKYGEVVRTGDLTKDVRYVETFPGMKSGLYVPMKIGEIAIGAISVESSQIEAFNEDDERLLVTLAAQAAAAIQNARMFSQSQRRAMESATLYEITSELGTLKDVPSLMQTIAKGVARMLGVPGGVVHLYDAQRSEMKAVASTDSNLSLDTLPLRLGEGMTGQIVQSHEPLIIDDYQTWESGIAQYKLQPFYSVLGVPMVYSDELIGVLVAHGLHSTPSTKENNRKFTERDVHLLSLFASAAAGAVYSARLLESERKRRQEAEILQKAMTALASSLDLEEILNSLLDGLVKVIPYNTSAVFIEEGKFIRLAAEKGHSTYEFIDHLFPLEDSMEKYVLEKRAPLILSDAQADPRFHAFETHQNIRGWMGLPLMAHEKVIGFLAVASDKPDSYDAGHAELAAAFANQAATAIENAKLFQDAVRYAQRWATLHALSQELARVGEDLDQVYFSIHNTVAKLLSTEVFTITLTDDKHTTLNAVYLFDRGLRQPSMETSFGKGLASEVIASGVSIKIDDDLENRPVDAVRFGAPDTARSILAVPLRVGDKVIGAMSVQNYEPNAYSSEDRLLLELLATQAAIAIENTRLFEEIRRNAQELKALNETTRDISTQQNNESLLQIIVERATELLHCTIGGFYLYDAAHQEMVSTFSTSIKLHTGTRLKLGEGAVGQVALTHEPIIIPDYQKWDGRPSRFDGIPFRAVLGVPVLYGGELIGMLEVREYGESTRTFTHNDATLLSLFAAHAASVLHNARLLARLKERVEQFSTLHSIDLVIGSSTDLRVSLQVVLESIIHLLKIDAAGILLYHPATFNLVYADSIGFNSEVAGSKAGLGEDLASHAAATRQMIDIPDLAKVEVLPTFRDMIEREGFTSYRCLPLIAKGEVKGVLELYHRSVLPTDPEWNDLLNLLAGQAAIAMDNAMLFSNLERANTELELAYDATIEGWSQALELRDHETSGHTRRLLDTTIALARKMGIPDSELLNIRRGVLLHDIGKMGVPDHILLKPGPLDAEEWKVMRQHPLKAYDLLSKIAYLRPALDIPYYHHEKWDGSGYPRGLKGEQIPISARIFSVVDVYDALSYDRPYRSAWSKEKVIEHIKKQSGIYFDPRVVETFLKLTDSL